MTWMLIGLVLFLGGHSVRIFAEGWRAGAIARLGEGGWKGLYSLVALAGLVLVAHGYGLTRADPVDLWTPPVWTRHLASLLTLVAFVLLAAAYVPRNRIRAAVGHPMLAGVKIWAIAHLLANGRLADLVLFGAILIWAVLDFRVARRRDRLAGFIRARGSLGADAVVVVVGVGGWAAFAFWLHASLIGVRPFG
jgi:uncharacterized membrane protein